MNALNKIESKLKKNILTEIQKVKSLIMIVKWIKVNIRDMTKVGKRKKRGKLRGKKGKNKKGKGERIRKREGKNREKEGKGKNKERKREGKNGKGK